MMFMVSNPQMGKKTHTGVLEFSAEEGLCYLPYWVRIQPNSTQLDDEQLVP